MFSFRGALSATGIKRRLGLIYPASHRGNCVKQVVIENPVINSPFEEPSRHFKFDESGITNNIAGIRRASSYFVPLPRPRKTSGKSQQTFDDWRSDRIEENGVVNRIRRACAGMA